MTLRVQLLVVALVGTSLPLSGWHGVRELDASLRAARTDAQQLALARLELAVRGDRLLGPFAAGGVAGAAGAGADAGGAGVARRAVDELYAERAVAPIEVDGYADDWRELDESAMRIVDDGGALEVRAAERDGRLYLMVDLFDATPVYHQPPRLVPDAGEGEVPDALSRLASGDALQVFLQAGTVRQHALLSPIAPGTLGAQAASPGAPGSGVRTGAPLDGWQAAWTDRPGGHRVELSMPLPGAAGTLVRLGIAATDVPAAGTVGRTRASVAPLTMRRLHRRPELAANDRLPRVYRVDPAFERVLLERVPAGARVRAFDAAGRPLADVDRLNGAPAADPVPGGGSRPDRPGDAALRRVFAFLSARDLPLPAPGGTARRGQGRTPPGIDPDDPAMRELLVTGRYVTPELDRVLGTLRALPVVPVADPVTGSRSGSRPRQAQAAMWLWYETNEEHSSTYTGSAVPRAFALLFLAGAASGLLSLGWAGWLVLRIRRLAGAATRAVAHGGRVRASGLPSGEARDEVGELARGLDRLLKRPVTRPAEGETGHGAAVRARPGRERGADGPADGTREA